MKSRFLNTDLLPLEVVDSPWLYENKYNQYYISNLPIEVILDESWLFDKDDIGKWMLFYPKPLLNNAWELTKTLYRKNELNGVLSMKCSTSYENPRASTTQNGIIILYCSNSSDEKTIMKIGENILQKLNYKEQQKIYYKTDVQTYEGTIATGCKKNSTYSLFNHLYEPKRLLF
jgi:hypothetical protein